MNCSCRIPTIAWQLKVWTKWSNWPHSMRNAVWRAQQFTRQLCTGAHESDDSWRLKPEYAGTVPGPRVVFFMSENPVFACGSESGAFASNSAGDRHRLIWTLSDQYLRLLAYGPRAGSDRRQCR